jgi:hypothetical protein
LVTCCTAEKAGLAAAAAAEEFILTAGDDSLNGRTCSELDGGQHCCKPHDQIWKGMSHRARMKRDVQALESMVGVVR